MKLIQIGRSGDLSEHIEHDETLRSIIEATVNLYRKTVFVPPWVGYVALDGDGAVGACGFKSPPVEGRVEIAYFTFPGHERKGIATAMAKELLSIAKQANASVKVFAQTLPEENASTAVLRRLGFQHLGSVEHPADGQVWEWEIASGCRPKELDEWREQ